MAEIMKKWILVILILSMTNGSDAQEGIRFVYKQVDTVVLQMEVLFPDGYNETDTLPAIVFFHGGSWKHGSPAQFENHARYFAKRGMVCFLPEYRVLETHGTTPMEALMDAKSAIRYIRSHADEYHINPEKIVGSGGSAGGHLAAASALTENFVEAGDDLSVSCKPNALVLFNPVIDTSQEGAGIYDPVSSEKYLAFSPLHNIRPGAPPTILFFGTKDKFIPVETARKYQAEIQKVGSRCDLLLYEGQPHGFFNFKNPEYYKKTVLEADRFLISIDFLSGEPLPTID
ncbi:MAG: alpha/beta hydrolase [Bacteroidales bacterium]|jgi:acetyl esterase/lipase|nr:alpha/beta hydrolase [Bacteroidales bacterium]